MSDEQITVHELKCWPPYFEDIRTGRKNFECRVVDRCFPVGDSLLLREFDPDGSFYTGRELRRRITYMLEAGAGGQFGIRSGHAVMALSPVLDVVEDGEGERPISETAEFPDWLEEAIGLLRMSEEHDENCGIPHPADPDQATARCTCGLGDRVERAEDLLGEKFDALLTERDEARFSPMGDNHHNAAACPYCRPELEPEAKKLRTAVAERDTANKQAWERLEGDDAVELLAARLASCGEEGWRKLNRGVPALCEGYRRTAGSYLTSLANHLYGEAEVEDCERCGGAGEIGEAIGGRGERWEPCPDCTGKKPQPIPEVPEQEGPPSLSEGPVDFECRVSESKPEVPEQVEGEADRG